MQPEIQRLRSDLETIRQAAGLGLPFARHEIWSNVVVGPLGLVAAAWGWWKDGTPQYYWGMIPLLIGTVAYFLWIHARYGNDPRRTGWGPKEYTFVSAAIIAAAIFALWSRHVQMPNDIRAAVAFFAIGVAFAIVGLVEARRRYWIGFGVPFALAGLLVRLVSINYVVPVGLALAIGGPAMAAIQVHQARKYQNDVAATD